MKRLLDETTDDFTRSLLVAGVEQRPPAGNKGKLLVALGAGSALGLFSSHAVAWLGTSGGKLSVLGVALGMAGAVYAVAPWSEAPAGRAELRAVVTDRVAGSAALVQAPALESHEAVAPTPADGPSKVAEPDGAGAEPMAPGAAPPRAARTKRRAPRDGIAPVAKRDGVAPVSTAPPGDGPSLEPEAEPAPPALGALVQPEPAHASSSLDAEVRLVDDMHWAARRNDREALARFLETYRLNFPDGQLKEEVSAFAARLERPAKR